MITDAEIRLKTDGRLIEFIRFGAPGASIWTLKRRQRYGGRKGRRADARVGAWENAMMRIIGHAKRRYADACSVTTRYYDNAPRMTNVPEKRSTSAKP